MVNEIVKTEDVMETFDKLDEHQAIAELKGEYLEQYVYSFKDKGVEVKGLSLMGVRETAREMNKRGFAKIAVSEREPVVIENDKYIEVRIYAKDELNGGGYWGIKRQQKYFSTGSENRFAIEQALSKAQRNAIRGLIPEPFVKEMIAEYLKRNLGVIVDTKQVVETIKDRQQTKQITTVTQTQNNDFDWSKLDLNKIPKWELSKDKKPLAPPIVKRLFAISKKYNIPPDEFKTICKNVTDKEHSYEWTYGNIKEIEETINTIHDKDTKEVEDIIAEPVSETDAENEAYLMEKFEMEIDK